MTPRELILLAGQKWRVFALGETPTADEIAGGLTALQQLVDELFVGWTDVDEDEAYEAGEDERIKTTSTVTLPDLIDDTRRPRPHAKVMVIDADGTTLSVYRADLGEWVTASDLDLDGDLPFDAQLHNTAADALAGRYCDLFGDPTPAQMRASQRALGILSMATRIPAERTFY